MERENEPGKGDYVGYQIKIDEGIGIQLVGPMERHKAIQLATQIANNYKTVAIRVFAKDKGTAILQLLEAFDRRDKLKEKGILP